MMTLLVTCYDITWLYWGLDNCIWLMKYWTSQVQEPTNVLRAFYKLAFRLCLCVIHSEESWPFNHEGIKVFAILNHDRGWLDARPKQFTSVWRLPLTHSAEKFKCIQKLDKICARNFNRQLQRCFQKLDRQISLPNSMMDSENICGVFWKRIS